MDGPARAGSEDAGLRAPRLPIDVPTRVAVRLLALALAALAVASVAAQLRGILVDVLLALLLALALDPLVLRLERRGVGRGVASAVVFLGVLGAVLALVAAIVVPLAGQVADLVASAPSSVEELRRIGPVRTLDDRFGIVDALETARASDVAPTTMTVALGLTGRILSVASELVMVLFLGLFTLVELPRMTGNVRALLQPATAERWRLMQREINVAVGRYVAGYLVISLLAGTSSFLLLTLLGIPFALALAAIVAILDWVPLVGASIGGAVIVLASLAEGTHEALIVLAFVVVYQLLENHAIQPLVMRRSVEVSPLVVLVSVLVGTTLFGIVGAVLAIPVAASAQIALREGVAARRARMAVAAAEAAAARVESAQRVSGTSS